MRAPLLIALIAVALGCSRVEPVTREDVSLSIGTTYDQWLYQGTAKGRHRFLVRSVRVVGAREEVDEREVSLAEADLPLRATMPPTTDRARWVEFFSREDQARPVADGMRVARIRRSLDYIPAPFGTAGAAPTPEGGRAPEGSR
jgi:hypothetical protein